MQNNFKLFLLSRNLADKYHGLNTKISRKNLPIYSVLIPLYKEEQSINSIMQSIYSFDYPKHLLDVKLIIEEDDMITLNAINKFSLEAHIEVIRVPYSQPRTKPKALNYAMEFIKGSLVVIYDAEDRPEIDQLLKAANLFTSLPEQIICLQGKLQFYNRDKNLLTRFFNTEYKIWFEFLLPSIDQLDLALPLGGNSNHFRVEQLKQLLMWDPYNVTEDADLGIRLYLEGFHAKMMDSYTFEESPSSIKNWLLQRARWIKGFIQTFLVFIRRVKETKPDFKSIFFIINFVGLTSYSFIILPFYILAMMYGSESNQILAHCNLYLTIFYMYFSALLSIRIKDCMMLPLWPFYFLLHIIASYIALYELLFKPFSWNKTKHFEE